MISIKPSRSLRTAELYDWTIKRRILPQIGKVKLKDLKPDRIQWFYNYLLNMQNLSQHAVYHMHSVLRAALNHAVKLGLMSRNPCSVNTALQMEDRFFPLYFLAIHTGMRMGELLGLKWEDIDWDRRRLAVSRQVTFPKGGGFHFSTPKSRSGRRTIILGAEAIRLLSDQKINVARMGEEFEGEWQEFDLVFPSTIGTQRLP